MAASQYSLLWAVAKIDPNDTTIKEQNEIVEKAKQFFSHMEKLLTHGSPSVREATFYRLSDCLLLFNRTLRSYSLSGLVYKPSKELIQKMKQYFQMEMKGTMNTTDNLIKKEPGKDNNVPKDKKQNNVPEDEKQNKDILEEEERQNMIGLRKSKLIAALGKLIAYSAFPGNKNEHAPDIIVHFVEHGGAVAETVKAFLATIRKFVTYDFDIVFHTLKKKYEEVVMDLEKSNFKEIKSKPDDESNTEKGVPEKKETLEETGKKEKSEESDKKGDDKSEKTLKKRKSNKEKKNEEKEKEKEIEKKKQEEEDLEKEKYIKVIALAKRLAESYGVYSTRSEEMRVSLANLLGECISWVVLNVDEKQPFLKHVASYFVSKLDALAAKSVLDHFDAQAKDLNLSKSDKNYEIFFKFRKSLKDITTTNRRTVQKKKTPTSPSKTPAAVDVDLSETELEKTKNNADTIPKSVGENNQISKTEVVPVPPEEDHDLVEDTVVPQDPDPKPPHRSGKRKSDETEENVSLKKFKKSKEHEGDSKSSKRKHEKVDDGDGEDDGEREGDGSEGTPPKKQKTKHKE